MAYNLIDERWIPALRKSGKVELIAPAEIADRDDPPLRIASPRPDFDGALLEFLIGLLQTAAAPASESEWERAFEAPPAVKALTKQLDGVRDAFFLDGDGPRFMQDLTLAEDAKEDQVPIGALLIDRIGEYGLEESPTLFAKPGLYEALALPTAAAALMALQTYAPAGGRGQLTSLRGGGPLTTLILGDTLWATAWLNVMPAAEFEHRVPGNPDNKKPGAIFPWMAATRTSATKGGVATPPQEVHPLQHLWGLPRRIRLVFVPGAVGACAVSGAENVQVVRAFVNRPDGTSYDGSYRHPLTPYSSPTKVGDPWNPKKGSKDGLPYRDWPLVVSGSETRSPAAVVAYFASSNRRELVAQPRLAAFGYAMSNMKPLRWCRSETPLITVLPGLSAPFAADVEQLVAVSEEVRKTLSSQVKAAWTDRPKDLDVYDLVNPAFWSRTEAGFFTAVHAVKGAIERDDSAGLMAGKEAWLSELHSSALSLFDSFVEAPADLAAPDLRRAVLARRDLDKFTRPTSNTLRKVLGLSFEEPTKPKKPAKGRKPKKESNP